MSTLSSEIVSDGAFFPQFDPHVPEKEMSQHAREHVMAPPGVFSYLIVIQAKLGLCLLEALLYSPADAAQPNEGLQSGADRRIADEERIGPICSSRSPDDQPNRLAGQTVLAQDNPSLRELVFDGAFCSFGHFASVPENVVQTRRELRDPCRLLLLRWYVVLLLGLSFVLVALLVHGWAMMPEKRITRDLNEVRETNTLLNGTDEMRTYSVDGIGNDILEGKRLTFLDSLNHLDGEFRFGLEGQPFRESTFCSSGHVALLEPLLWNKELRIEECIPFGRSIRGKHPDLAVLHFAKRATILLGDPGGILSLLDTSGLIDDQNPGRITHVVAHQDMVLGQDGGLIPNYVTYEALHRTDIAALNLQSNWLNRLPLNLAELPNKVTVEVSAWLAP